MTTKVFVVTWDGEKFDNPWKCTRCGKNTTVANVGFTYFQEHQYLCIDCLMRVVKKIQEAILLSKIRPFKEK
jgi:hypothetical protein